jgi:hypothetical protein
MNSSREILLISNSDDLTATICEQFLEQDDFVLRVTNFSEVQSVLDLGETPTFLILGMFPADKHTLSRAETLQAQLPKTAFFIIHQDQSDFDFSGIKFKVPFKVSHLLKLLHRTSEVVSSQTNSWLFSGCEYNSIDKNLIDQSGAIHRLTEKEAAILTYLYEANGNPVSRENLLKDLWGYHSDTETHTVETHVYRLRQKIEKDLGSPRIIVTDHLGYRLIR